MEMPSKLNYASEGLESTATERERERMIEREKKKENKVERGLHFIADECVRHASGVLTHAAHAGSPVLVKTFRVVSYAPLTHLV